MLTAFFWTIELKGKNKGQDEVRDFNFSYQEYTSVLFEFAMRICYFSFNPNLNVETIIYCEVVKICTVLA